MLKVPEIRILGVFPKDLINKFSEFNSSATKFHFIYSVCEAMNTHERKP